MKIAFISDVHIGPSGYYKGVRRKLAEYSETFIKQFIREINDSRDIDFALHLGDLVQDAGYETDIENFKKGLNLFNQSDIPVHHLVGNHDTIDITVDEIRAMLGKESLYYSFDRGGFHFVIMYSNVPVAEEKISVIETDQLKWLEKDLSATPFPAMVFIHHSLADQNLTGNPWFEERSFACLVSNRAEVRRILETSGKVIAVVNGHLHWNRIDFHNGIPHITVQSAIENFQNDDVPANSWGIIDLNENRVTVSVYGNDRARYEHTFS